MPGVIDAHGHVWSDETTYEWVSDLTPPGAEKIVYTLENYREEMNRLDIDRAVLVATPIHGPGSPYTIACLREYPKTFTGIVLVEAGSPDAAIQVNNALAHDNVLGVRLTGEELAVATTAFWQAMARHGGQIHLLVGPDSLPVVLTLAERYPNITFVLDHLALHPSVHQYDVTDNAYRTLGTLAEFENVYAKLTHTASDEPHPFTDIHNAIRYLCNKFGTDRLFWGSDYIYHFKKTTPEETLSFLDELPFLSDVDRDKITRRNAARVLL